MFLKCSRYESGWLVRSWEAGYGAGWRIQIGGAVAAERGEPGGDCEIVAEAERAGPNGLEAHMVPFNGFDVEQDASFLKQYPQGVSVSFSGTEARVVANTFDTCNQHAALDGVYVRRRPGSGDLRRLGDYLTPRLPRWPRLTEILKAQGIDWLFTSRARVWPLPAVHAGGAEYELYGYQSTTRPMAGNFVSHGRSFLLVFRNRRTFVGSYDVFEKAIGYRSGRVRIYDGRSIRLSDPLRFTASGPPPALCVDGDCQQFDPAPPTPSQPIP